MLKQVSFSIPERGNIALFFKKETMKCKFFGKKFFSGTGYRFETVLLHVIKEVFLFVSARAITGLIEIVGVPFLVDTLKFDAELFGTKGMMAKVCISVIVIILNYVFSKLFVFKKETVEDNENE